MPVTLDDCSIILINFKKSLAAHSILGYLGLILELKMVNFVSILFHSYFHSYLFSYLELRVRI